MGSIDESAAELAYRLAMGEKLSYSSVKTHARSKRRNGRALFAEVLELCRKHGIDATPLVTSTPAHVLWEFTKTGMDPSLLREYGGKPRRMSGSRTIADYSRGRRAKITRKYLEKLAELERARIPDAKKLADLMFTSGHIPRKKLAKRAKLLAGRPLLYPAQKGK